MYFIYELKNKIDTFYLFEKLIKLILYLILAVIWVK